MKNISITATVTLSCLATSGLTAPAFTGPSDVVRRSSSWLGARHMASLDQEQVEQISNDIKSNLTATIQLITKVSEEEPAVNPPFQNTIQVLQGIVQSIGGALASLASMKGGGMGMGM